MARVPGKVSTPTSKASPSLGCLKFLLQKLFLGVSTGMIFLFQSFSLSLSQSLNDSLTIFFNLQSDTPFLWKKKIENILEMSYISFPTVAEILSVSQSFSTHSCFISFYFCGRTLGDDVSSKTKTKTKTCISWASLKLDVTV